MAHKRSFGPSVINSANVKLVQNGTSAVNNTALAELAFWLPLTIPHLDSRVKGASTFKELRQRFRSASELGLSLD